MDAHLKVVDQSELSKQQAYADKLASQGFDFGLAVGSAFAESMRNTYYKNTGTTVDEIIDNSIEAGADNIHIALGYSEKSEKKPDAMAIIDNGHGMPMNMIRLAVLWGGTHREGSRTGFGRFGFGLPSASVNQARRYSVFSRVKGGNWNGVSIDLDDIRDGKYTDKTGRVVAPEPKLIRPPKWVFDFIETEYPKGDLDSGTVILWEKLDRVTWKTTSTLTKNLSEHLGVTYRNYIGRVKITVNGEKIYPTDPLFVTAGYRYFDLDEDRAMPLENAVVSVAPKDGGQKVNMNVRYAYFNRSFYSIDKTKDANRGNQNQRWSVTNANHGIILNRMGRQIHVLDYTPWPGLERFSNDDRYWAVEIDFPAELDEEFTVSNSKQGAFPSDRIWDLLKQAGVENAIRSLRKARKKETDAHKADKEPGAEARISEKSMLETEKFKRKRTDVDPEERERKAKEALEQFVKRTARETRREEGEIRKELEADAIKHPYRVQFDDLPGAPFFRVEQIGGMKVLFINREHRFFSDLYAATDGNRYFRASLEILLFVIGECELDSQSNPDRKLFYASERQEWSLLLSSALELLSRYVHETDIVSDDAVIDDAGINPLADVG